MVKEYNFSGLGLLVIFILIIMIGFGLLLSNSEFANPSMSRTEANAQATSYAIEAHGTEVAMNKAIEAEEVQQQRSHAQTAVAVRATQEVQTANASATAEISAAIAEATQKPLELAVTGAEEQATAEASYLQATQSAMEAEQHMNEFNAQSTRTAVTQAEESRERAESRQNVITLAGIAALSIILAVGAYIFIAQARTRDKTAETRRLREEQKLAIARMRAAEAENRRLAQIFATRTPPPQDGSQPRPVPSPTPHGPRPGSGNGHSTNGHSTNGHSNRHTNGRLQDSEYGTFFE